MVISLSSASSIWSSGSLRGGGAVACLLLAMLVGGCGASSNEALKPGASDAPDVGTELFTCADDVIQTRVPPPIDDLAEQELVIKRVAARYNGDVAVKAIKPTPIGPIALVGAKWKSADFREAERLLLGLGVRKVYSFASSDGLDDPTTAVGWSVDEALPDVRRVVKRSPGFVDLWVWPEAGSIQLFWHGEVPAEVQALVGELPGGVRVDPITQVPYPNKVLMRAQNAVFSDATDQDIRDVLSFAGRCHDYRGIRVGVIEKDEAQRAEIARRLSEQVGLPVMVEFEERGTTDG